MVKDDVQISAFFKAQGSNNTHFELKLADIILVELNKFLKSDSADVQKFFSNLELLKTYRRFAFYTFGKIDSPSYSLDIVTLNDLFFQNKNASRIDLKLIIVSKSITKIIKMTDCQQLNTLLLPTPFGTVQTYTIHYQSVIFMQ